MHRTAAFLSRRVARGVACALLLAGCVVVQAQVIVRDAWVRGTVAQQGATGLFATITSAQGGRLVAASSPVAGTVEIHEMAMDGNVMRMRPVAGLDLPAGRAVELRPGGYHVMLMGLRQPLKAGDSVPVRFVVEGAGGRRETVDATASVRSLAAPAEPHRH